MAAVMVVTYHSSQFWTQHVGKGSYTGIWHNGAFGVDVFFVISGFVMAVSALGRETGPHPARNFLQRRIVRLVPLYWLVSLMELMKLSFVRGHREFANATEVVATPWTFVVSSLLFIPYRDSLGTVQPLLYVGWSLSFEMLFYLLFALALALRVDAVRFLSPVLLSMVAVGCFHTESWPTIATLLQPFLLEFLAGVLLGQAMLRGWKLNLRLAAALGGVAVLILLVSPAPQDSIAAFALRFAAAYLVVQSVVMMEGVLGCRLPRWSLLLGDASYSLYLVHPLVFAVAVKLLSRMHLLDPGATRFSNEMATIAIGLSSACLVALPLYLKVEKPMTL